MFEFQYWLRVHQNLDLFIVDLGFEVSISICMYWYWSTNKYTISFMAWGVGINWIEIDTSFWVVLLLKNRSRYTNMISIFENETLTSEKSGTKHFNFKSLNFKTNINSNWFGMITMVFLIKFLLTFQYWLLHHLNKVFDRYMKQQSRLYQLLKHK